MQKHSHGHDHDTPQSSSGSSPARERPEAEQAQLREALAMLPGGALTGYRLPDEAVFVSDTAQGARLIDTAGRSYVDYVIGAGALILGHGHPDVARAVADQAAKGVMFFGTLNPLALDLAAELVRAIPCAEKIAYATTGSEATMYAMRLARAATGRDVILKFEGGYHGNHDYAQIGTTPRARSNYPLGSRDTAGMPETLLGTMMVAPYNDLEVTEKIVARNRDRLAAIIVEPIQRGIPSQPGFLAGLRRIADHHGLLLIFDEVVTGFRLAYGGAQSYYGVVPDLASFGKIIGGGLALGAVAGPAALIDQADPARRGQDGFVLINGTLHGNPLSCAAGIATLAALREPGTYDRLNRTSTDLRQAVAAVLRRHDLPARVVGEGSLWHIVFLDRDPVSHADMMAADAAALKAFDTQLISHGVNVLPGVRRLVCTAHGDTEVEDTLRAIDSACRVLG